ncbi:unnamed protein product [Notodromas monacha]|uniref:Uncharacterized protein n=1 Tax=Notodromas monacha TaxID=399045 RepID=A0A7R9BE11_9CRUS|nr:unnamed protein product [Notodromas monacha]CAG0912719.1 unnamed protein product [Notodromas monacha]
MEDLEILSELSLSGVDSTDEKRGNSKAKKDETLLKLQKEREVIEKLENCPIALKLILEEIGRVSSGRQDPLKSVDLNRDIPINLHTRIKIPCKEFPKEEELRQSKDPKFAHLHEELHLDVHAYASPSLAHARMAYALSELRKFLIPVSVHMRNGMQRFGGNMPNGQSNIIQQQTSAEINRQKVMSILDKARKNQMEFASGNSAIGLGSYHSNYGDGYFGGNGDYGGGYAGRSKMSAANVPSTLNLKWNKISHGGHGQQGMGSGVNAMQANQRRSAALWL